MNIAKVQHYVPKFLLRHFGTGKNQNVKVFDKKQVTNLNHQQEELLPKADSMILKLRVHA